MKKLTLLMAAIFALVAFPAVASADYSADTGGDVVDAQSVNENSDVTLDVLAAIELSAPDPDSDKIAPSGAEDVNKAFSTKADLRSNLDWSVSTSLFTTGEEPEATNSLAGGTTGSRNLLSAFGLSASGDEGNRNTSNSVQEYSTNYDQDVSWGDEAGTYTVVAKHTAVQSLTDDN